LFLYIDDLILIGNNREQFITSVLSSSKKANVVCKGMWVVKVRKIWLHGNRIVLKNDIVNCEEIFYLAQIKWWSWTKYRNP